MTMFPKLARLPTASSPIVAVPPLLGNAGALDQWAPVVQVPPLDGPAQVPLTCARACTATIPSTIAQMNAPRRARSGCNHILGVFVTSSALLRAAVYARIESYKL